MEISNKITDFTKDGECSRCNQCCGGVLPITQLELKTIRRYVREKNIKPVASLAAIMVKPFDMSCPFAASGKCNIYEVRPQICRLFICSMDAEKIYKQKEELYQNPNYKQIFLRDEIFGEKTAQVFVELMGQTIL